MTDQTTSTSGAGAPRRRGWLKIALAVSLAVNMLIVGFAIGAAWRFARHRGPPLDHGIERMVERLQEPVRSEVRALVTEKRAKLRDSRSRTRAARRAAVAALLADPFDRPRFETTLAALKAAYAARIDTRFDKLADVAEKLSVDDRRELLRSLRHRRLGGHRWPRRPRDDR